MITRLNSDPTRELRMLWPLKTPMAAPPVPDNLPPLGSEAIAGSFNRASLGWEVMTRELIEGDLFEDNLPAAFARFGAVMRPLRRMPRNQPFTTFRQPSLSTVDEEYIAREIPIWLKEGVISEGILETQMREHPTESSRPHHWLPLRLVVWLSAIFSIPKKQGDRRFIMNGQEMNQYFEILPAELPILCRRAGHSFKIESLADYTLIAERNWYGATLDLASGYWQLGLREETARMMGFVFRGKVYRFEVLVFGHHLAPALFTRTLAAPVAWLRSKEVVCLIYLDDILVLARSARILEVSLRLVMGLFRCLGCKISVSKSCTSPSQSFTWLGTIIDTNQFRLFVPEKKIERVVVVARAMRDKANHRQLVQVVAIAQLVGQLVAMERMCRKTRLVTVVLMGWLDRVWSRTSDPSGKNRELLGKREADALHLLVARLRQWSKEGALITYENAGSQSGSTNQQNRDSRVFTVNTDASLSGYGACLKPSGEIISGRWSDQERLPEEELRRNPEHHISLLELKTFLLALQHWARDLRGRRVRPMLDSAVAASYIRKGRGKSAAMSKIAYDILETALQYDILLLPPRWVPSALNEEADRLSRSIRVHDWTLTDEALQRIETHFKVRVSYDRFATRSNRKTWLYDSLEEGRDTFSVESWTGRENLIVCPFALLNQVLNLMKEQGAKGIVVAPVWPRKLWWPTLMKLTSLPGLQLDTRRDFAPEPLSGFSEPLRGEAQNWKVCAFRVMPTDSDAH